jgi:hypothetical protein
LPNLSLITDPEKIAYMIFIYSQGFRGEDDFGREARISDVKKRDSAGLKAKI